MKTSFYKLPVLALTAVIYCGGCSQDFLSKEDSKTSSEDSDDEGAAADPPVEVSGSFLTIHCDSEGFSIDEKNSIGEEPTVSCLIKNADGTRFNAPISAVKSQVFIEGQIVSSETVVSPSPPWHFYVQTSEENRKKLSSGNFEVVSLEKTEVVETKVFDYKWYQDPIFALVVAGLTATPDAEQIAKAFVDVETWVGQNSQFVFVSDHIFPGNLGVENADNYCSTEGKKLLASRDWRALLGSATETVRERIQIKHRVFNLFAGTLAMALDGKTVEQNFWDLKHLTGFRITQTGRETHLFEKFENRLQVVDYAWSGFNHEGGKDTEYGDCNSWTSNDANVFGGLLDVQTGNERWARYKKFSCDSSARIICISL